MSDTYSFQDKIRDVSPVVDILIKNSPTLLSLIGDSPNPAKSTKHEYLIDELNSNQDPVASTFAVGDAVLAMTVGTKFKKNDIIGFEAATGEAFLETVQVTGITGNNLDVTRQYNGLAKAEVPAAAIAKLIARPRLENAVGGDDETNDRGNGYNYTQIFDKFATTSRTRNQTMVYGVDDELNYQMNLRLQEMVLLMEMALLFGHKSAGSTGVPRTAGGILDEILNDSSALKLNLSGALTASVIDDAVEDILTGSGLLPSVAICGPKIARKISALDSSGVKTDRADPATGRAVYGFRSAIPVGGLQQIIVVPQFAKDALLIANPAKMLKVWMQRPQDKDATQPGQDGFSRKVVSELTYEYKNYASCHKYIYNINL